MFLSNQTRLMALFAGLLSCASLALHAAEIAPGSEYARSLKNLQSIQPHGDSPFGEQVNLYTGSLTFRQADAVLEGSGPSISLVRTTASTNTSEYRLTPHDFGNWMLSVPRIETLIQNDMSHPPSTPGNQWIIAGYTDADRFARCTRFNRPMYLGPYQDAWNGMDLYTEDGNQQAIMKRAAQNTAQPTMAGPFPAVTHSHWQVGCLPNTSNGETGEAFFVVSPNGTKYWFDRLQAVAAHTIKGMQMGTVVRQRRLLATMYVTRVEDRFGNYLLYNYTGDKLTSITASDGRQATIAWRTDAPLVDSITLMPAAAQPRSWHYEYLNPTTAPELHRVVQPDGSAWTLEGIGAPSLEVPYPEFAECNIRSYDNTNSGYANVTITHPSGLIGKFGRRGMAHGRNYVPSACHHAPPPEDDENPYEEIPVLFNTSSLVRKELLGPGQASKVWNYEYPDLATGTTMEDACYATNTCPSTKLVKMTDPDGNVTQYTYSNRFDESEGKLLETKRYQGAASLLRSETYGYALHTQGPYPSLLGSTMAGTMNATSDVYLTPVKLKTTVQQGTTFTWQANSFDNYGSTASVTRSSTLGDFRTDVTTYHHNAALWVIGQQASSVNSDTGLSESQTEYDGNAMPWKTYAFGNLQQTLTYDTTSAIATGQRGTLKTVTDGNNHTVAFGAWKRGMPQAITFADSTAKSAVVEDLGQITSVTDETGAKTCYGYDAMGRVNLITYPSESQAGVCNQDNWLATAITFAPSAEAKYGLPANHWRRTEHTGNAYKVTFYDASWRPVVQEVYDITNTGNTLSQTVTRYDADGQVVYASYPQRNFLPAVYNTWADPAQIPNALGSWTTYDALNRPTQVQQNSELGLLTTTTEYLAGFQTRTTNPRGSQVVTQYQVFDEPSTSAPNGVTALAGADTMATEIHRDKFGKPTLIKRRNQAGTLFVDRRYVYDGNQRLCKTIEPETGATVIGYDNADNVNFSASGLTLTSTTDCDHLAAWNSGRRVERSYDARNRLQNLTFPDGRGDQVWQYWLDGAVKQITTYNEVASGGRVDNNYTYNKRRLLLSESIAEPGNYSWSMGYTYSSLGALASLQYPDGLSVNYAPNVLGQPTQAGSYATGVSYYPNGAMQQFTYGNGIVHTLSQNDRQLPDTSQDAYGGTLFLSDGYDYDQNGNVAAISDATAGNRGNRDMTYDGLDRLKTAASPMFGSASYTYDALDNIARVNIGGPATRDHYYCYDTSNRLTNIKTSSCGGTSVIGLGYDVQGNVVNKNGQAFDFDYGNRMREATGKEVYRYDGNGRRVSAQAAAGTIYSFYGQDGVLRSQRDERRNEAYDYIHLNGSLVARATATTPVVGVPVVSGPASDSDGSYTVQWTAVTGATLYELQESVSGGAWQAAYSGASTNQPFSGKATNSYDYRARACKSGTCGNWSATWTVVVNLPPASAPTLTAPVTAANGDYEVSWNSVAGATSYTLEESANGGAWTSAYVGANLSKAYSGKPAGSYGYRIKACNDFGCSGYSATKTVQAVYVPAAPVLSAPSSSTNGSYTVSWAAVSMAATYRLEESVNSGAWTMVQDAAATSKAFSGKANGSYRYQAQACNAAGCSAYSAIVTVGVLNPPASAPSVTTPASNTTGSYTVSWTAVATATSYSVERNLNGGAWSNRYSGANLSLGESGLGAGNYGYRAQACNGSGCSGWSTTQTTQVILPPAMPASLTGNTEPDPNLQGSRYFYIYWSAVPGATYYDLQQAWTGGTTILYSGPNTNAFTSGKGNPRTYHVRACNTAGCSAWKGPLAL